MTTLKCDMCGRIFKLPSCSKRQYDKGVKMICPQCGSNDSHFIEK